MAKKAKDEFVDPHKDDAAKAGRLSKRKLKTAMCWLYVKGKCTDPQSCTRLHVGQVLDDTIKAQKAAQRKEERKQKGKKEPEEEKEKPKKRKSWLCPGCGNRNFGRREECNGATCDTLRPANWKELTDADHTGPPPPERKHKKRRDRDEDSDEDGEAWDVRDELRPIGGKNKKRFEDFDDED
mmetsp:Transcript_9108/g.18854  ORF Transcript_9108/g.18854 Transcript_9108/m.18854 type:complete len:182 (-) Transcript_9108:1051-1596(-)|eukprot:CAMPEP_0118954412 /NCGR_PEP_ID=MMETSP1169-20130426/58199_1 /TAXON_ID=36882 /ORGANISM="Pyramimonas obovata, Strain CCMP722" /LENGTH=181 /DNA_ID=CAMNT_0006902039 /DNA_START=112 /DNA_END=657 /DNA_ORIENTATION=-